MFTGASLSKQPAETRPCGFISVRGSDATARFCQDCRADSSADWGGHKNRGGLSGAASTNDEIRPSKKSRRLSACHPPDSEQQDIARQPTLSHALVYLQHVSQS